MAQQKIQSVQLSDSGVVPGPYTSADVTVDAAGRITAISNGGGGGTVTSVAVNGTAGRVTSSGSPITGSGSITLDLATTTVTPGVYTTADITVDAYGRITAATNGAGSISAPLNEVIYGTGSGVTSGPDLTFDSTTDTLVVGAAANGAITAETGFSIALESDGGTYSLTLGSAGDVRINGSAGSAGEVLTSAGSGSPAYWAPAAGGGGMEMNVFVMTGGSGSFDGSLINNYTSCTQRDETPTILWDPDTYGGNYTCLVNGVYEIVVECRIVGDDGSSRWPDDLSAYGVDLFADYPASNTTPQTKLHTRYSSSGLSTGNLGLQVGPPSPVNEAANTSSFTERFIVRSDVGGIVYPKMFAYSYGSTGSSASFSMSISFMRISAYTPA